MRKFLALLVILLFTVGCVPQTPAQNDETGKQPVKEEGVSTETKDETVTTDDTVTPETSPSAFKYQNYEKLIAKALSEKVDVGIDRIKVADVNFLEAYGRPYARGIFKLQNPPSDPDAGAIFFAFQGSAGDWIIPWTGNGVIFCELVVPYGFPKEMTSDCVEK